MRKLQKIRDGFVPAELVNISEILRAVVREYGAVPNASIILNNCEDQRYYVMANGLIHDVFSNLVGNAIKHSNGMHAVISITIEKVREAGNSYYKLVIEDNGPGISDDLKVNVFSRMLRGTTNAKGMGLGLYLVKSLTESYNGKVWVEDRVPGDYTKGAKFVVLLPAAEQ